MNSDEDKELKQLWTKYSEAASQSRLNQKEIAAMVEQVIERPLRKMRTSLISEIIYTALICTWFAYYGLQRLGDWPLIVPLAIVIVGCIYALCARVHALRGLQQVRKQTPEMILQALQKSIEKMNSQNRRNVRALLLVVFCLCAVIVSKICFSHMPYFSALGGSKSAAFWSVSIATAAAVASAYAYVKYYRRRFYREPMERMQKAIREIEQEN